MNITRVNPLAVVTPRVTTTALSFKRHQSLVGERTTSLQPCSRSRCPTRIEKSRLQQQQGNEQESSTTLMEDKNVGIISLVAETIGLVSQPVVWLSLATVATTGAGLPAGPFGLVGALEGISYLVVLGWVAAAGFSSDSSFSDGETVGTKVTLIMALSKATLVLSLATLALLIREQGCIPNAKPLLDYSAYVPICNVEDTPGFFGL